jgi:hypothetical protein
MLRRIHSQYRKFRRDEGGTAVVETFLMFPTLFVACLATYVFFEAFRSQSNNLKAAYTISDALSRRGGDTEGYVTGDYLNSMWRLHRFITTSNHDTSLRVSVISFDEDDNDYFVCWSEAKGELTPMSDGTLDTYVSGNKIPVLPDGQALIVVETQVAHEPIFTIGRDWTIVFEDMIVTAPRFTPQLKWSTTGNPAGEVGCF